MTFGGEIRDINLTYREDIVSGFKRGMIKTKLFLGLSPVSGRDLVRGTYYLGAVEMALVAAELHSVARVGVCVSEIAVILSAVGSADSQLKREGSSHKDGIPPWPPPCGRSGRTRRSCRRAL